MSRRPGPPEVARAAESSPRSGPATAQDQRVLALAAAELGLSLPASALQRLLEYRDLLVRWNRVYNLTAVRDPEAMLTTHLIDCLALVGPVARHFAAHPLPAGREGREGRRILDVGSGAGLPGIVLAIAEESWRVDCIDAVAKKSAFVRQAAAELGLANLRAIHGRVEDQPSGEAYDLITSRAFAALPDFCAATAHLLAPGACWVAMKARPAPEELAGLPEWIDVFHVEPVQPPGLTASRCLVWMRPRARRG